MTVKAQRLHLRLDPAQKALLEVASAASGDSVPAFVLAAATEAAASVVADRRVFVLDEDAWRVVDEAIDGPARDVPGLRELLSTDTVLNPTPKIARITDDALGSDRNFGGCL